MPIDLIGIVKPKNNGQFPLVEDVDFYGGYQVQASTTTRDAIPALNLKVGMLVYTRADDTMWRLTSTSPVTWVVAPLQGPAGVAGAAGPTGPVGPAGAAGAAGP